VLDFFTQYQEAGPNYIHALLTGYGEEPPQGVDVPAGSYYNPYFLAGASIAMPPPLSEGVVTYSDGSPETVDQYSRDVSAFLMWAAEPHLVTRKRLGFQVGIFLVVFAGLMYLTKKRVWSNVTH
jgi:ubiquinol-cytochrome c reductase cytochrome c1 subunit